MLPHELVRERPYLRAARASSDHRPTEVQSLLGDSSKARDMLGSQARVTFPELALEMVREDLDHAMRTDVLHKEGFVVREPRE